MHRALSGLGPHGRGVIANLGHGVTVETEPESVGHFVKAVRQWQPTETFVLGNRKNTLTLTLMLTLTESVVIGSRKSKLAMVQALDVQATLMKRHPAKIFNIQEI